LARFGQRDIDLHPGRTVADESVGPARVGAAPARVGLRAALEPSGNGLHRNFASHPGLVAAAVARWASACTQYRRHNVQVDALRSRLTFGVEPADCVFDPSGSLQPVGPGKMFEANLFRLFSAALTNKELIVAT
jgi:hypothetical protein